MRFEPWRRWGAGAPVRAVTPDRAIAPAETRPSGTHRATIAVAGAARADTASAGTRPVRTAVAGSDRQWRRVRAAALMGVIVSIGGMGVAGCGTTPLDPTPAACRQVIAPSASAPSAISSPGTNQAPAARGGNPAPTTRAATNTDNMAATTLSGTPDGGGSRVTDNSTASSTPGNGTAAPGDGVAAPGGGGLRVVERGFTQVGAQGATVSLGAVLENTSGQAAYRTRITFRVFDERQETASSDRSGELLRQEIPVILPGQRIGAGAWTYVRDGSNGWPVKVSGLAVEVTSTTWLPGDGFTAVPATHQSTERSSVEQETGTVRYEVTSAYCQPLPARGVAVLFRDGTGKLVGGSFDPDNAQSRCQPGRSEESARAFRSIPPEIDNAKTAIYPYCDVSATASGAPVSPRPPSSPS